LRALSSGVAPPLLQDRGLAAALDALAAGSPLRVQIEIDPAIDRAVSQEVARTVYFVVAELMTNVVKHAGATGVTLRASLRRSASGAHTHLDVWVVDNGRGGAALRSGHGLEGLRERVAGLRGQLVVKSPLGGPTSVGAHIPLAVAP
jgi:signal transduction histidine kinase